MLTYSLENRQYLAALSGSVSAFFGGGEQTVKLTVLSLP
jgi:alcohol dehydrogenase (cytochrome c)